MSFINEMHYFRLPVANLEEAISWYTTCLGLKLRRRKDDELAVMELPEGPLLILVKADEGFKGHFTADGIEQFSIGFTCPDIHTFYSHLVEQEVRVEEMQEDEGHYYFCFYDLCGNKLQAHW